MAATTGAGRHRAPAARFVGAHTNKIDAKGRVSTPADFRKALEGAPFHGVVCFPSFKGPMLDAGGLDLLDDLMAMIAELDPYDDDREAFELAVMGESRKLAFDGDGRIVLPQELRDYAGLDGQATFVGLGTSFQIWNPEAYAEKIGAARRRAVEAPPRLKPRAAGREGA